MTSDGHGPDANARTSTTIPVVELRGTETQMGHLHGKQLREEIGLFYDELLEKMCSEAATTEDDLLSYARAHVPAAKDYAPDLVDEIRGISEGAGLAFERIMLINCYDEVSCHGPHLLTKGLHGCTAFAASGRATTGDKCYVGQSWDVPPYYPPYLFKLVSDSRAAALMLCHPGMVGGAGINGNGLALAWTTLKANDAGLGVPAPFVVRKALQAESLSVLIGNVLSANRANGMGLIAGDTVAAVNIKLSAARQHVTYSHGVVGRANHYESPAMLGFEDDSPVASPGTFLRSGRMNELLQQHAGTIGVETLMGILSDHASAPGCICRHEHQGWQTCASVICDTQERVMWASNGRPCEAGFVRYSLAPHGRSNA